jgi:hypothetical protein
VYNLAGSSPAFADSGTVFPRSRFNQVELVGDKVGHKSWVPF